MEIVDTLEVRWFMEAGGALARAARAAFADVPAQPAREDWYLVTGRDDLGIKVRREESSPAKLEVKYLVASLGARRLHVGARGVVERWRKLSVDAPDQALPEPHAAWLRIAKRRRATTRRLGEAECNTEVAEIGYDALDRRMELVTVGIEAFGPGALDALLRAAWETFETFALGAGLELGDEQSRSYPGWLRRIAP